MPASGSGVKERLRLGLLRLVGRLRRPAEPPGEPVSILVIRPDHIGDLVLSAPALAALRQALPNARLTGWVGPWGEAVWRQAPALDALETCPFPGMTRGPKPPLLAPYGLAFNMARRLRGRFDLALNLRADYWWAALAASWAGIPVAGFDVPECRPFLSLSLPFVEREHETARCLRLVAAVAGGAPTTGRNPGLSWPSAPWPAGVPDGAIAIHPGAGAEVKLWREERWAAVADGLAVEAPIVLNAGSPSEEMLARAIAGRMSAPAHIVAGLDLARLANLYRRCRLVVGPDNGPLHIARSVGTPTVGLFGPSDPCQFGPYGQGDRHEVVRLAWRCIPCGRLDYAAGDLAFHPCVALIDPADVLSAARRLLAKQPANAS